MIYKNNRQMRLVKVAKLLYDPRVEELLKRMQEAVRAVYDKLCEVFRAIHNVYQERLDSPPYLEYIKLPKCPVAPHAIQPTNEPPMRTVFLPIKRFRGQR